MTEAPSRRASRTDEQNALRRILQGTASDTGQPFFRSLVENLAGVLGTHGAWVTEYLPESRRLRALAFWLGGEWVNDWEQHIDGSPCQVVVEGKRFVHLPDRLLELYPGNPAMARVGTVSYMGVPLSDLDGTVLGHLAVLDRKPMPADEDQITLVEIFASRAAAELRRLRAERDVRDREAELSGVFGSALDAIVQLDAGLSVVRVNPAAERLFEVGSGALSGAPLARLLSADAATKVTQLARQLLELNPGERSSWVAGGLTGIRSQGSTFPAEASLAAFECHGRDHYSLILRNIDDRIEAERRIQSLTDETEYLKAELRELGPAGEIVGKSPSLLQVLRDLQEVAPTTTSVLVLGETGTGKELFARAIHAASPRRDRPLVKVNCAAIPAALIESEFFGHERGAFTGATARRDGRFTLADGGTIFLDEIGELPVELQGKLLRVLQEGEFEPVGSSRTRRVDVRVVAATNRDLLRAVSDGKFREDLYYRLSVFPITLPPLRDRGSDVVRLAEVFARKFAARMGKLLLPLSRTDAERLMAYNWPGNVRELENVIERAVITARDGALNLERALPAPAPPAEAEATPIAAELLTADDLVRLERDNLVRALELSGWQVAGESGAARRLGMAPSTLSSRMKALGIKRGS